MAPPPKLTLSQWADAHRHLSPESSAEPGRWNTARAEYQRGIMDAVSDPRVERVVLMTSARVGKTQVINNLVGYHIHQDPAPILVVQPTTEDAEGWSKGELAPMLRDTPALRRLVKAPRSRDAANTLRHKLFPGGQIFMVGANAPSGLAAKTIRVVCCDEVDRYPASAGTEGDPVSLAIKRTTTFWNRKIILASTPTIAGTSRIEAAYKESDQRRFWVPCPHCSEMQTLAWERVKWIAENASSAAYHCEQCGAAWSDAQRWAAVRLGEWRAAAPFRGIAGFHISELYSPWRQLSQTVQDYLDALHDAEREKVWRNTSLGETWLERGDAPPSEQIFERREERPRGVLPEGVVALTGAADVQGDRLEWDVWAWGAGLTGWLVDSGVIEGRPQDPAVWAALREVTQKRFTGADGRTRAIDAFAVDAGYSPQDVYRFVQSHPDNDAQHARVRAIRGSKESHAPPMLRANRIGVMWNGEKRGTVQLWYVGVHGLKFQHYGAIRRTIAAKRGEQPEAGALRLPTWVDEDYCGQLVSERLATVQSRRGGGALRFWDRIPNVRNERLDTAVYARGLAHALTDSLSAEEWSAVARHRGASEAVAAEAATVAAQHGAHVPQAAPTASRGRGIVGTGRRLI